MIYDEDETSHYEDVLLTPADVQTLSSPENVVAFFAMLHYDTNEHVVQTPAAMGLTSANLRDNIQYIERVASNSDFDVLEVYLFQLRSLTVASRNEIIQRFRYLTGNYLLVLTDDYDRLDFVLLERYQPMITTGGETLQVPQLPLIGNKPVNIRPHVLPVDRRKPDDIVLRALRRFTFTENDTIAQYEKLLNAYIVASWSEQFFNNRALFSDYYLTQRLKEMDEWKDVIEYGLMRRAHKALRALYEEEDERRHDAKAEDIRAVLLEPALQILGFRVEVSTATRRTPDDPTVARPDYYLFDAQKQAESGSAEKPLALCLTYPWGRNLDGRDERRDPLNSDENPGAIVVTLLDSGEADWAIVTNGVTWRLYAAKAHSRATNYYEINIPETLALDPGRREEGFRYFWLLFRAAAFTPVQRYVEGETRLLSLLDYLLIESDLHARDLGERLKNRVFEKIFPHFAAGFVSYARRHKLLPADLEALPAEERNRLLEPYFNGTLTFLYRLLFLFYAESRDLLPIREERSYYEHSLERMKVQIAQDAGKLQDRVAYNLERYSEVETTLYDRLMFLFAAVDKGNPALNVPLYNGGLFMTNPPAPRKDEPPEITVARFLHDQKIPNRYLALGLDLMARDIDEKLAKVRQSSGEANEHSHALIAIDYKSLGVRHLGSIYEGLLEFKLRIAPETMAVVEGKRTEEIVPYAEAKRDNRRILKERQDKELKERLYAKGSIYLENDRRERKSTGSYYTPDYIVKYIVEQTVGPLLKQKLDDLRPVFRDAQRHLDDQKRLARSLHRSEAEAEQETYKNYHRLLNEVFFAIKVLDPSMGSGHFLVEIVDYVTDQMAKWLNGFKWNPIVHELSLTRKAVEDAMKDQGVSVDMGKLTDLNLLKRRVLKSCIYGIDLNPMAVELAKVSLWLDCFTLGAPLSFLDHHIKCGNSLIGAEVKNVHRGIQESLFGYQFQSLLNAARMMRNVSKLSDITAKEVAESRSAYQQAYDALQPYKRLFDVWLSQYFGNNKKAQDIASEHAQAIIDADYRDIKNESDIEAIKAAPAIAANKRFFHWELEFPEVYFDDTERKEDGGFDAVVGNPPYVRQEGLGEDKAAFKALYKVYNSIADLYTYFIEHSHKLLRPAGRFGMITANKFMRANYGAALRKFLISEVKLEKLIDFGDLPVFEEASAYPIIIMFSNIQRKGEAIEYAQIENLTFESLPAVIEASVSKMPESAFSGSSWSLSTSARQEILNKLKSNAVVLEHFSDTKIQYGIKTGFNEAFVIDKATRDRLIADDSRSVEIIKPFLVGENVRRYSIDFRDKYLIWTYIGIAINEYPAIYRHLLQYQSQLEARWDKGKYWWELRHCDYYADFEKPKIIFPDIAERNKFVLDYESHYSANTTYILPIESDHQYLISLLNSSLIEFFYRTISASIRGGYLRFFTQYVNLIPIRRINFITSDKDLARYRDKARLLYRQCLQEQGKPDSIKGFVNHHLSQQPEASDVAHDLLAFLAQEMLDLNKQKRVLQKKFLEEYLVPKLQIKPDKSGKTGLDVLTGKGKLQDYPGDYQKGEDELDPDELWEIIRKNKARLNLNLAQPGLKERIQAKYQESLNEVLPLKEQLKHTDALIDQVVYLLYGLTEEEIAIVEGK